MSTNPAIGIWLVGAFGGVGTTATLGLAALQGGRTPGTGLVTELPLFDGIDLDPWDRFVIGGHDIRQTDFAASAAEMHRKAGVFSDGVIDACRAALRAASANVSPGTVLGSGPTVASLVDWSAAQSARTPLEAIERIATDIRAFQAHENLDHVVVINVASTEPPFEPAERYPTGAALRAALDRGSVDVLPASSLYALAALDAGCSYVNFTPSLGISAPALVELADQAGMLYAGKDGKTGETLLKSVLAPMFADRNLEVMSWVGHNIFGNRDGVVLTDPTNKASKVKSKDQLLGQILGYKPQTLVTIEYIESMDDWKTAWDHIHFRGFLGTKMTMQFTWQGCDSLLAAPLVLDLARLTAYEWRRGGRGRMDFLASFFKSPEGIANHNFFDQFQRLVAYVQRCRASANGQAERRATPSTAE